MFDPTLEPCLNTLQHVNDDRDIGYIPLSIMFTGIKNLVKSLLNHAQERMDAQELIDTITHGYQNFGIEIAPLPLGRRFWSHKNKQSEN